MLERQDLDALLVGALYGELSSAEEARLTAHLDSHPADRSALDDLKSAHQTVRQKVATSRIFELQLDPPQALSAILLQEAARRAPKLVVENRTSESWFQRFVRSFIAHPAMAAAATLVLVVGVSSMIYLKKGAPQIAEPSVSQADHSVALTPAATPTTQTAPSRAFGAAQGSSSGPSAGEAAADKGVGGNDKDSVAVALDEGEGHAGTKGKDNFDTDQEAQTKAERDRSAIGFADGKRGDVVAHRPTTPSPPKPAKKSAYVEVPPQDPQPKELDELAKNDRAEKADKVTDAKPDRYGAGGGAAGPSSPTTTTGTVAAAPPAVAAAEPPPPPLKQAEADAAWAKDQHAKITALVKAGKCGDAVPLAKALSTRAPAYFAANVMTDRELKSCMQYVNDTSTEKAQRYREPAAATKAK